MADSRQVVVVGAGIVGAACARRLALAGLRVSIVDPRPVGSGATAAGMGHVVVMDDSPAQFALTRYSQTLWDELAPRLPGDCELVRTGTIWVAADDAEMLEAQRKAELFAAGGVAAELLDAKSLIAAEPQLRSHLAGGLRVPGDSVVYPPCVARWLLSEAVAAGATPICSAVAELTGHAVRLADGTRLTADAVICAAGSWTRNLLPELPIRPRKGHLLITDRYPGWVRHQLLELGYLKSAHGSDPVSVAFNVQPRATGQLLIGSSRQFGTDSAEVEPAIVSRMVTRALEYMPALARVSVLRAWTGFRAATPDGLPIIGLHPRLPGVYLASGHEGLGITTSLGTAELVAAELLGLKPPLDPLPYRPERLLGESLHV